MYDHIVYSEYFILCYLNLEKEVIPLDSDDDVNSDDKNEKAEEKKKKYDKKSEEKTLKQDDVRLFLWFNKRHKKLKITIKMKVLLLNYIVYYIVNLLYIINYNKINWKRY